MAPSAHRVLSIAVGLWLLAVAASGAYVGYQVFVALWTDGGLRTAAVVAVGSTLVFGYLSYRFGARRLLAGFRAKPLSRTQAPGIHERLDRLVERMDVDRPELFVTRMRTPNAFALGGAGVLVIDASLFELLDADELETIVAHELAHLEGRDGLTRTLAYSLLQSLVGLVLLVLVPVGLLVSLVIAGFSLLRGRSPGSSGHARTLRRLFGGVLSVLAVGPALALSAYSRRQEFAADDRAAAVTGNPLALARALRRIERASTSGWELFEWFSTPREETETAIERLFSTHPATDDRIERLHEAARTRERAGWQPIEIR